MIARMAIDTVRAHRKRDITTDDALHILTALLNDEGNTEFTEGVIHRAITCVTGIPIVEVTITEEKE
jgi:hypothetical protein